MPGKKETNEIESTDTSTSSQTQEKDLTLKRFKELTQKQMEALQKGDEKAYNEHVLEEVQEHGTQYPQFLQASFNSLMGEMYFKYLDFGVVFEQVRPFMIEVFHILVNHPERMKVFFDWKKHNSNAFDTLCQIQSMREDFSDRKGNRKREVRWMLDTYLLIFELTVRDYLRPLRYAIIGKRRKESANIVVSYLRAYKNRKYQHIFSFIEPPIRNAIAHKDYRIDLENRKVMFRKKALLFAEVENKLAYLFHLMVSLMSFFATMDFNKHNLPIGFTKEKDMDTVAENGKIALARTGQGTEKEANQGEKYGHRK